MSDKKRSQLIISVLDDAFAPLMKADPVAFRAKYRKMAADPHAFYRGSACLFYADVADADDPYIDDHSGRIWVHGDLHVEPHRLDAEPDRLALAVSHGLGQLTAQCSDGLSQADLHESPITLRSSSADR